MMDTKIDKIWREIIEEEKKSVSNRLEGEMTVYDFMKETGLTRDQAVKRLNKQVKLGKLAVRRKIYIPELGGVFTLYRPVVE